LTDDISTKDLVVYCYENLVDYQMAWRVTLLCLINGHNTDIYLIDAILLIDFRETI